MAKKTAAPMPANEMAISNKALTLKGEIEACHREVLKSGNEMIRNAVRVGELLTEVQSVLKASKSTTFGSWVEQFLPFSERSARSYIKLHNELEQLPNRKRASVLESADSINEARRLIAAATNPDPKPAPAPPPPVVQGEIVDDDDQDDLDTAEPTDEELRVATAEPPTAPAGKTGNQAPPVKALEGREAEAFDARRSLDGIHKTIGQWFVRIDEIRNAFPHKHGDDVLEYLKAAYELMKKWEKAVK